MAAALLVAASSVAALPLPMPAETLVGAANTAKLRTEEVLPKDTDPEIDIALEPHYVAIGSRAHEAIDIADELDDDGARSERPGHAGRGHRLFLFMTGALGLPSRGPNSTRLITEEAAANGFHAINLRYPNDQVLLNVCGADGECYESQRLATIYGGETDRLVVTRPNSIENRLIKVLAFLHRQHPEEGWSSFLENDSPRWSVIVVAGWSQGGGNAALIARDHRVARVIMLEAPVDRTQLMPPADPAPWVADAHVTPARRYFALAHLRSASTVPFFESAWRLLGLDRSGPTVNVDTHMPPYNRSHQLATNVEPARPNLFHHSVAADTSTPKDADGRPVLAVVWQYMLGVRPR
jgi:hypothetical protein